MFVSESFCSTKKLLMNEQTWLPPTRFFLAPINTGYAANGVPTSKLLDFHRKRSGMQIGVAYVGNVAIADDSKSNDNTAVMRLADQEIWRKLAQLIYSAGTVPALQLACKVGPNKSARSWKCRDKSEYVERMAAFISDMEREQIQKTVQQFIDGAILAAKCDFQIVQIHAAHGYLLALLLNRTINRRNDEYADGTLALQHILEGVKQNAPGLKLDVRVSLFDGIEAKSEELAYRTNNIARLTELGYDIISLSAGMYDIDRSMIYPTGRQPYLEYGVELSEKHPHILWNVAGRLGPLSGLGNVGTSNLTFGIGRPLIADPGFVEKSLSSNEAQILECKLTNKCHYFSRGKPHIECGVNKDV